MTYSVRRNMGIGNLAADWNVVNDETDQMVSQWDYWSQAFVEVQRLNTQH